ncbi:MAG: TlpA family protein disulfide reductase [Candidatus Omnitrophota bacterium]|nr:MAG: TlpA family protein disulfide reductase [Candidatus Omnitrophota bacterium]
MRKILLLIVLLPLVLSFRYNDSRLGGHEFFKLEGESIVADEIINGSEKTVLFFWTSWCYFCRRELKKINRYPPNADDVKFYYVNLGETPKIADYVVEKLKLKDFIADNIVLDKESVFVKEFNIIGLPTYVFLKEGRAVYRTNLINQQIIERVFSDE